MKTFKLKRVIKRNTTIEALIYYLSIFIFSFIIGTSILHILRIVFSDIVIY